MPTHVPIVFWSIEDRPSLHMRGRQIAEALAQRGYRTSVRFGNRFRTLADVRNSVVVCIKRQPPFLWLKARGNVTVFDAVDYEGGFWAQPALGIDAIVAGSQHMRERIRARMPRWQLERTRTPVVYHHADPGLKPHRAGERTLRLAYNGEPDNSAFLSGELPALEVVSFREPSWRENLRAYNCHFSARVDVNKSTIKLANAAVMGAGFLCGREPGCVELLGADYPLFLDAPGALDHVRERVEWLGDAIGGAAWKDARERLDAARAHLTLEASADAYEVLIEDLLDAR